MNLTTHHTTSHPNRSATDYRTNLACTDCQTLIAAIHHVVRRRGADTVSATLYVDGVQTIDLGTFKNPEAARLSAAKLHRLLCP